MFEGAHPSVETNGVATVHHNTIDRVAWKSPDESTNEKSKNHTG